MIPAVRSLMTQYNIPVVFPTRLLKREVANASCENCSIEEALDRLFADTLIVWEKNDVGQYTLRKGSCQINGKVVAGSESRVSGVGVNLFSIGENGEEKAVGETLSSPTGRFYFEDLKPGRYGVRIEEHGFASFSKASILLEKGQTRGLHIYLEETSQRIEKITVTPGYYIFRDEPVSMRVLTHERLQRMPRFAEDVYRSVDHVPGISSPDLYSSFRIRGGDMDETLILFDGVELVEPFHFKDVFFGLFSIIDNEAVGDVELMTAGLPIEYGNKMSGVLSISSPKPDEKKTVLGITTLGVRVKTEASFRDGQGAYLLAIRKGFFNDDILLTEFTESANDNQVESDVGYWDMFSKVAYQLNENHRLTGSMLIAGDHATLTEPIYEAEGIGDVDTEGGNTLYWLNLHSFWTSDLTSRTTLYAGRFTRKTKALDDLGEFRFTVNENRRFNRSGLRSDWTLNHEDRHLLKWGLDLSTANHFLDYDNAVQQDSTLLNRNPAPIDVETKKNTQRLGIYLADRIRLRSTLTAEFGLRYDEQTHTGDRVLSPRIFLNYAPQLGHSLKFGWGRFYQPQDLFEIQAEDGEDFYYEAELAEHWILNYEHRFQNGFIWRNELYLKNYSNLHPHYINFLDPHNSFMEVQGDRARIDPISGKARGFETSLFKQFTPKLAASVNYTISDAKEHMIDDLGRERDLYHYWDQRHALNLSFDYVQGSIWSIGMAFHYHKGWRTTDVSAIRTDVDGSNVPIFEADVGPYNDTFFPSYHRMDLHYRRTFLLRKRYQVSFFVDVTNIYNRRNVQSYADHQAFLGANDNPEVSFDSDIWIPQIANLGFHWTF